MANTPRRRGLLRVAAALAGLAAAAGAAELTLRMTHWGVYAPRRENYNFTVRPGMDCWFFDREHPPEHVWDRDPYGRLPPGARMTYAINSHGLRGPEPAPGRTNVLLVGDSFTFGEGVELADTFASRVERAFAGRFSPPVQTVAAAVPGYGSRHQLARLPGWLDEFKPRAVVVVFVPNDPIPLDDNLNHEDVLLDQSGPPSLYLGHLLRSALGKRSANRAVEQWYESYYFGENEVHWAAAREALSEMQRLSLAAGARFGVVLFPLIYRLDERPFARIHAAVAAACSQTGTPFLDLTPVLAGEPARALSVHPTDAHPAARAHELASEALTPFVEGLLR